MTNQIYPCLWFDNQAVQFEIEGTKVMGLNGGPMFKINPSISLFVTCTTNEEIERIWGWLAEGGNAMMTLDKYPWSEKYGWMVDKFGMTWQLMFDELPPGRQKIIPSLLFVGDQFGKAEQAIKHYSSIFHPSAIHHLELYPEGGDQPAGHLMFGRFSLNDSQFAAMDGPGEHDFRFNEGVSLVVECENQEEIDYYWEKLTDGGAEVQCGWLRDKFNLSWQVIPKAIGSLMSDPEKSERVMQKVLKMIKLDLDALMNA
jgi:predicted 3-demethylubiquinone-9 3-methyltransferase (glyoxalase superfamily)